MSAKKQTRNRPPQNSLSDFQRLFRRFMSGLLRSLFLFSHPKRFSKAGFVLPTTVLLLLMVTLTAGANSFRKFSRTQAVISQREQEVVVGSATPAIDRAKAKIEYLFAKDIRLPGGLPRSNKLQAMMLNIANTESAGSSNVPLPGTPPGKSSQEVPPYTLPDETRLDINGDNKLDNAWSFPTDIDGDGSIATDSSGDPTELIVYSVIMDDAQPFPKDSTDLDDVKDIDDPVNDLKADALVNRNASIDTVTAGSSCPVEAAAEAVAAAALTGAAPQRSINSQGWEELDNVSLLKNFQIDVFVINDNAANRTVSTLEFQQVRQAVRGNKWGAWFKNDIELFPGLGFVWNGAMHTEGSIFLGNQPRLNMISAHASCLYPDARASEITLAVNQTDDPTTSFEGQFVVGKTGAGYGDGSPRIDWFTSAVNGSGVVEYGNGSMTIGTNSDSVVQGSSNIMDVALDPVQMFTADISRHRNATTWCRAEEPDNDASVFDWEKDSALSTNERVLNQNENTPFLDDLYRADNRYGPKSSYTSNFGLDDVIKDPVLRVRPSASNPDPEKGVSIGTDMRTPFVAADSSTTPPTPETPAALGPADLVDPDGGLDGYWERQAI